MGIGGALFSDKNQKNLCETQLQPAKKLVFHGVGSGCLHHGFSVCSGMRVWIPALEWNECVCVRQAI